MIILLAVIPLIVGTATAWFIDEALGLTFWLILSLYILKCMEEKK